ncbi:MAG: hypothetical protein H7Z43_07920 [Clostridia bacterium]|nr:hypothetical protein [Deltaproteobacteria bacterium]
MLELAIVLATVGFFAGLVVVIGNVPLLGLVTFSLWMIALGMGLGIPAGFGYHVAMHRGLTASKVTAPHWWWSPVRYHVQLDRPSYRRVMPWFFVGVLGASLALAGCGLMVICYVNLPK